MSNRTPHLRGAGPITVNDELLELGHLQAAVDEFGRRLHSAKERAVLRARLNGASWGDVGTALGISRQGAQQRWRHLEAQSGEIRLVVGLEGPPRFHSDALGEDVDPSGASRRRALAAVRSLRAA